MRWFGFGFNAFGQIYVHEKLIKGKCSDAVKEVKVVSPTELASHADRSCFKTQIRASWSRRASLHLGGKSIRDKSNFNSSNWTRMNRRCPSYRTLCMGITGIFILLCVCQVTAVCASQVSGLQSPPMSPAVFL